MWQERNLATREMDMRVEEMKLKKQYNFVIWKLR